MSGQRILKAIWRLKWLAIVVLLVFLGASALVTALLPEEYQATSTVRVIPDSDQPSDAFSQLQTNQGLARTYAELLKSPSIYREVVDQQGLSVEPEDLRVATEVSYVEGTELIQVQVEDTGPREARNLANLLARTFIEEQGGGAEETLVLADPALVPTEPVSPSWPLNMALALLLGLVVAGGGTALLDFFGDRVYSEDELAELAGAPVLGFLPRIRKQDKKGSPGSAPFEEAINSLRVNLGFALGSNSGSGVVLFTSTLPEEGKTTVAGALAKSYALAKRKCLLADADLRKPQVHARFGVRNIRGLSNLLLEGSEGLNGSSSEVEESPNLTLLTSGAMPPNPVDLLTSGKTKELIYSLREQFDTVILDSPPALALADASVLGSMADGVLLVVDTRQARRRKILRTVEQLRSGNARILGIVLNHVSEGDVGYYSYG